MEADILAVGRFWYQRLPNPTHIAISIMRFMWFDVWNKTQMKWNLMTIWIQMWISKYTFFEMFGGVSVTSVVRHMCNLLSVANRTCTRISKKHYNGVIMSAMASQITSLTTVYSTVYSRCRSKKTSKLHVTGLCAGNSLVTGEFPAQRATNADNISIWWRVHDLASNTLCKGGD